MLQTRLKVLNGLNKLVLRFRPAQLESFPLEPNAHPPTHRQPQHIKGSSAAVPSTKCRLDHSEENETPELRQSKRARTSTSPTATMSNRGTSGDGAPEENEAPTLRRSTRARTSTTPPTTSNPMTGEAGGDDSKDVGASSLRRSKRAQSSTTPPTTNLTPGAAGGPSRVKIYVKDPASSGLGSKAAKFAQR